ncbi:MAG: PQQ-dependent sugar dehydrogenase [Gammaproteobacteria bacterium]|nr:PQQ-dependent sugar dehydrogenase [Gammaproteobacteria bacterium]
MLIHKIKNSQILKAVIVCCLLFCVNTIVYSYQTIYQDKDNQFIVEEILNGLGVPWGMTFLSTHELLFTQRDGKIGLVDLKQKKLIWLKNTPSVYQNGQGGLLDVMVADDYAQTGWIYFTYSKSLKNQSTTALARAKLQDDSLINWQDLLVSQSLGETTRHYGSRITFDDNGHLFFSIGDRGHRPNGQDLSTHAGSILRLNLDGSIPDDNPFVDQKEKLPEIWTYGHRNPQGLFYDKDNKRLWSIEHGPRGGDEINLISSGKNYGWPVISYGKEYWGPVDVGESTHKEGMEQPVKTYIPSIAPGSLLVYSGKAFPQWRGDLFSGALKLQHLNRVVINSDLKAIEEERLLNELYERIRCVIESPEGWIYISTDSGRIMRIKPK